MGEMISANQLEDGRFEVNGKILTALEFEKLVALSPDQSLMIFSHENRRPLPERFKNIVTIDFDKAK